MVNIRDLLDLLGERQADGRLAPSRNLEELQRDVDPETGAFNDGHLDTITGELIDPSLFSSPIGGPLDALDQPTGSAAPQLPPPPRGIQASPFDAEDAAAYGPSAPVIPVSRSEPIAPPTLPNPGFAPNTGSVQVPVDPNQRYFGPATLREHQIQGLPADSEADATAEQPFSMQAVLMGMLKDATGGILGEESERQANFRENNPLSGIGDSATAIAPFVVGGGPAAQLIKRGAGAIGGSSLWEQLLSMIRRSPRRSKQGARREWPVGNVPW
jgi:hypothetical protein